MENSMNDTHDSKFCTVDRVGNTLVLMDADGEVLATHEIAQRKGGRREAKGMVNRWLQTYMFEAAIAMNLI
jgi:hypothetical protein